MIAGATSISLPEGNKIFPTCFYSHANAFKKLKHLLLIFLLLQGALQVNACEDPRWYHRKTFLNMSKVKMPKDKPFAILRKLFTNTKLEEKFYSRRKKLLFLNSSNHFSILVILKGPLKMTFNFIRLGFAYQLVSMILDHVRQRPKVDLKLTFTFKLGPKNWSK